MELGIGIASFILAFAGFAYLIAFGQVPLREALPHGIRSLFRRSSSWTQVATFKNRVTAVAFSLEGNRIASGGFDDSVHLIDYPSKAIIHFAIHSQIVRFIQFGRKRGTIYSCGDDGRILALDPTARRVCLIGQHEEPVYAMLTNIDETLLCSVDRGGNVCLWNAQAAGWQNADVQQRFAHPRPLQKVSPVAKPLFALTYMATEDSFLCAGVGGKLFRGEIGSFAMTEIHDFESTVFSLAFDAHHNVVYAGCSDGKIRFFDFTDDSTGAFEGHTDSIRWVLTKPPNTIISSSKDRTIRIWSREDPSHSILEGHKDYVYQISLSPDGTKLASACGDGSVFVWNLPK